MDDNKKFIAVGVVVGIALLRQELKLRKIRRNTEMSLVVLDGFVHVYNYHMMNDEFVNIINRNFDSDN